MPMATRRRTTPIETTSWYVILIANFEYDTIQASKAVGTILLLMARKKDELRHNLGSIVPHISRCTGRRFG